MIVSVESHFELCLERGLERHFALDDTDGERTSVRRIKLIHLHRLITFCVSILPWWNSWRKFDNSLFIGAPERQCLVVKYELRFQLAVEQFAYKVVVDSI